MVTQWLRKKTKKIFALDLGTTKFCIAQFSPDLEQKIQIVDLPARGMKKGMIADFNLAEANLKELIKKAEQSFQTDIQEIVVGIAGSHLHSEKVKKTVPLQVTKPVQHHHIEKLVKLCEIENYKKEKEILHTVGIRYQIDQREPVENPVGFCGSMLKGEFLIVFADSGYTKDVVRLCNQSGLKVKNLFAEPFASSVVTLQEEEKQMGCVVADIGGGTTDGIVYQGGKAVDLFTINIAGQILNKDLASAFHVSMLEAEHLKTSLGLQYKGSPILLQDGKTQIHPKEVYKVLAPRLNELAFELSTTLVPYKGCLGAGLFFTGGGSGLQGISPFFHHLLKIPCKAAKPSLGYDKMHAALFYNPHQLLLSRYATVVGLLNLEISESNPFKPSESLGTKYFDGFINWIKEMS